MARKAARDSTPGRQLQAGPSMPNQAEIIEALGRSTRRTQSLEVFGNSIVKEVLQKTITQIKEGKPNPYSFDLKFTVRIFPPGPPQPPSPRQPPSPEDIDICYEICGDGIDPFMQCYVDCSGPNVGPKPEIIPARTCEDIWRDYRETTDRAERFKHWLELFANDCLDFKKIVTKEDVWRALDAIDKAMSPDFDL